MTDTRQPSCEEQLPDHLAGRLADLRAILAREDPDEGDDELPPLNEYGLGSTVSYAIRVDLSTGGPADYVTATVRDGEVQTAAYHFADWFDHAERVLHGDDFDTIADWLAQLFDLDSLAEYMNGR